MRVKFNKRIYFCTVATHTENSQLLLLTTSNGIYTVDMRSAEEAEKTHNHLLTKGFYDFSNFEYGN